MTVQTFADRDHGRDNNFNLVRMVAASAVLVSHSWTLALGRGVHEPLIEQTGYSLGIAAVIVFFAVSGYFITKSFDRRTLLADFLLARVARIFPALIVALCLTAFVLGPALTTLPLERYFQTSDTWIYAPKNALLVHQQFDLPGLFGANPFRGVVNGSLWTLKYEVACYAGVIAAGYAGLLRPRTVPLVLLAAAAAAGIIPGGDMTMSARVAILCTAFAVGGGLYVYRARVPISGLLAAGLAALAFAAQGTMAFPLTYAVALGYAALAAGFGRWPALLAYNRVGDYSYGVYIYAFPVQQSLIALFPTLSPWGLIATSFPVALLLAIASWMIIESPALAHRHRLAPAARAVRTRWAARREAS